MKKVLLFASILFLLVFIRCKEQRLSNESLYVKGLHFYVKEDIVTSLDSCIEDFDLYLGNIYKDIEPDTRVKKFLNDYTKSYISDESKPFVSMVESFNFFKNDVQRLEKHGFFNTEPVENMSDTIPESQKWINSILFKDKKINDSIRLMHYHFAHNNVIANYYYGISRIANKRDTLTAKWLDAIIVTNGSIASVAYTRTLPEDYLNSTICKTLIFTEYILPFYNHNKEKFEIVLPVPVDSLHSRERGTTNYKLAVAGEHPVNSSKQSYHSIQYKPDISIGKISLLNPRNVNEFLGEDVMNRLQDDGIPHASVLSSDLKQRLTFYFHHGNPAKEFSEFQVNYVGADELKGEEKITDDKEFITESGIKPGITIEKIKSIKGEPTSVIEGKTTVLQYKIDDYNGSEFLKKYNMPAYYAYYEFQNGYLITFRFGFVYP